MADTIMAMLIASASVEINMVSPFAKIFDRFACSTLQAGFWLRLASRFLSRIARRIWVSRPGGAVQGFTGTESLLPERPGKEQCGVRKK